MFQGLQIAGDSLDFSKNLTADQIPLKLPAQLFCFNRANSQADIVNHFDRLVSEPLFAFFNDGSTLNNKKQ